MPKTSQQCCIPRPNSLTSRNSYCRQLTAKFKLICNSSSVTSSSDLNYLSFPFLGGDSMPTENPEISGVNPNHPFKANFNFFCNNSSVTSFYLSFPSIATDSMHYETPNPTESPEIHGVLQNLQSNASVSHSRRELCDGGDARRSCMHHVNAERDTSLSGFSIKPNSSFSCSSPLASSVSLLCLAIVLLELFQASKMAKIFSLFTLTSLLVLSIALNISLIKRVSFDTEKTDERIKEETKKEKEGPANQRTLLSVSTSPAEEDPAKIVNLNHGDPTMYEKYWMIMGDKTTVVIPGWSSMSYFSDVKSFCWFLEPELSRQIVRLHKAVGNAVTEERHIVIGTGSSQLIMAAMFALSPVDGAEPISVVSAAPYYSSYPVMSTFLKSGLFRWAGDARSFNREGPYIEFITSPNNPDGFVRSSTVNRTGDLLVHDLAYYWPQYTPIASPADHDLSLFTFSKATGNAGQRIGWAIVKDREVAKRMVQFVELNTIGVSRDSQLRAAKVLEVMTCSTLDNSGRSFFHISYKLMAERWQQLRALAKDRRKFSLPEYVPGFCHFFRKETQPQPAFAWLKCDDDEVEDCETFFKGNRILTRGGSKFGVSPKFVRISMVNKDINFALFLKRLSKLV